jgi:hypothetical protein
MIAREIWLYAKMARLMGDGFPLRFIPDVGALD